MSHNAIQFVESKQHFLFDGYPVKVEKLGRLLANALIQGAGYIDFEEGLPQISFDSYPRDYKCAVSVNYVREMLEFTGRNGWFWDCLDQTRDHAFDNTKPTPGTRWEEANELFRQAREGFQLAADLRHDARSRFASPVESKRYNRQAGTAEREARQLTEAAWLRLMPGISLPPTARR